jgi:hypothetical protein
MESVEFNIDNQVMLDEFKNNPEIVNEEVDQEDTQEKTGDNSSESNTNEPIVIGTITSAAYGGFTKILSLLTSNSGKTDIISIEEGKLSTISGGGFLYCDLSMLFGENNFDIIDPQYSIKLLKLISGGDQVTFIDDDANSRYLISNLVDGNPQINIKLPKPDPSMNPKITKPDLGELQEKVENIDPDLVNTITSAEKNLESQYFILEIIKNPETSQFEIISISTDQETFKFNFKDSWKSDDGQETQKYKLFNPFPIPKPDEIEFQLYKSGSGELWVKTESEVGMAKIEYNEKLTPMGLFDSLSLI